MSKLAAAFASIGSATSLGLGAAARTFGLGRPAIGAGDAAEATGDPAPDADSAPSHPGPHADGARQLQEIGLLIEAGSALAETAQSAHDSARLCLDAAEYQLVRLYQEFPQVQALCAAAQAARPEHANAGTRGNDLPAEPLAA